MKYSTSNKPLVCMQTNSTCYKGTSTMTVKGVLWHSTGANNPTLKRYVQPSDNAPDRAEMLKLLGTNSNKNDWNHITHQAGLNCWIGKLADGTVTTVQTMPWNYKPWGCGSGSKGSCNNGWIQFEICEDNLNDKTYFDKVYKEACEITAYLCQMYNIDPKGTVTMNGVKVPTILCHADSHALGLGSNHGDVNHWFPKYGKSMATVREDVAKLLAGAGTIVTKPEETKKEEAAATKELYRVRKTWANAASQIGAYENLNNAKAACDKAGADYEVYDSKGNVVYKKTTTSVITPAETVKGTQARDLNKMTQADMIAKVGPLFTADQEKTGVLAAISMAQFILESGYADSELAVNANNCFGMKKNLSGNTWAGSTWDGKSVYEKTTQEHNGTEYVSVVAAFRKYSCVEDSIEDHSAYLVGAKNGSKLRYEGLKGETDYKKAAQIIKDGGYATSPSYVTNLCNVIEKWNLTKFNSTKVVKEEATSKPAVENKPTTTAKYTIGQTIALVDGAKYVGGGSIPKWVIKSTLYVREIRSNGDIVFSTLKTGAITGVVEQKYIKNNSTTSTAFSPYLVKIDTGTLNVRTGPGTNYKVATQVRRNGVYTIVGEQNGWGKLKSGAGWISLNYTKRI